MNVLQQISLREQAMLIAEEIFSLIYEYTHDSSISKFFLTDEIAKACYGLAGGFASVVYTPVLEPEEIKDTAILTFLYAILTYGFNIYLRERSFKTNASAYTLPDDHAEIKKAQKKILALTSKGELVSTPLADMVISIIVENVHNQIKQDLMKIKKHKLNQKKFLAYTRLSLYWGYNFAQELIDGVEEQNKKNFE